MTNTVKDLAREQSHQTHGPILVNVGLPRTGTQSFTAAVDHLGFRAAHVVYGEHDPACLKRFRRDGEGKIWHCMQRFDVVSDSPVYGLIRPLVTFHSSLKLVATTRSKGAWLQSMGAHPGAGGPFMKSAFGTPDFAQIYDRHNRLLSRYKIPKLELEMKDEHKWEMLCTLLEMDASGLPAWPHVDLADQEGFQNDSLGEDFEGYEEPAVMPLPKRLLHHAMIALRQIKRSVSETQMHRTD